MGARRTADEVFSIPELLELILLHLPKIDLFVAQRTSQAFATTIAGSPELQRKLFVSEYLATCERDSLSQALSNYWTHRQQLYVLPFMWLEEPHKRAENPRIVIDHSQSIPGENLGWKGKKRVHATGSWRNMKLGSVDLEIRVGCPGFNGNGGRVGMLKAGCTIGDLFDMLEPIRQERFDDEERMRELALRRHTKKSFSGSAFEAWCGKEWFWNRWQR